MFSQHSWKENLQHRRPTSSKIRLDYNHEQLNDKTKGIGGAIGLTENNSNLQRWLLAGLETARLIDKFGYSIGIYQLEMMSKSIMIRMNLK